jgi:hypothetical protein
MCDNAREFISDLAHDTYNAYDLFPDPMAPHAPQAGGLWKNCVAQLVGDVKRRSATNLLQAPWMPASMRLLSDQYAAGVQMYYFKCIIPSTHRAPCVNPHSRLRIQRLDHLT